ncbi:Protein LSM14 A [Amphibalanus amphitrite]|uniref:Protein LSM14 A n=1 Tax=Amphibalanus amphitrite TaxID=1232801 RepID=A0A6A4XFW3_AMPAM|nr:Protein LSM14 A [Amphibalanus amphitrite]
MGSSTSSGGAPGGPLAAGSRLSQQPAFGAAAAAPAPAAGYGLNGAPAAAAAPAAGSAAVGGAVSRLPPAAAAPGGPVSAAVPAASSTAGGGDLLAGSSRSTTPSRRSPTMDQGVQTQQDRQHRHRDGSPAARWLPQQLPAGRCRAGGGYRSQRGGRRGGRGQSRGTFQVSARPIKFDGDFDFEEANKKFEELAAQLAKTKITPAGGEEENGEAAGGDESAEEGELHETSTEEPPVFYNKTKSFFDNISCDAIEKARDNRQRRQDWQKERKQNLETFGVEGTRRPYRRGGYGRGYYNNRGGPGGGGGYYNNRGGGGYYNNRGGYRGYYNNYNRGYGGGGGRRGGGDGQFQPRGGRSNQEGRSAAAEAADN